MSKPEEQPAVQQEDVDIQHDDEFEDFKVSMPDNKAEDNKKADYMDDWDDDREENFTNILRKQRELVH